MRHMSRLTLCSLRERNGRPLSRQGQPDFQALPFFHVMRKRSDVSMPELFARRFDAKVGGDQRAAPFA